MMNFKRFFLVLGMLALGFSCGDEDADALGVGAQCKVDDDCNADLGQKCLDFKGGYCGIENCSKDSDCPDASRCVTHDNGKAYCFLVCEEKTTCNENRENDFEANCSSSVTFVESTKGKACIPPS